LGGPEKAAQGSDFGFGRQGATAPLEAANFSDPQANMSNSRLRLATLSFVLALAAILGAWGFQIFGGYVPCKLCLEERIPYYVGLPLLAIALVGLVRMPSSTAVRVLLGIVALIFVVGVGLAVYHAGAEWKFWAGPSDCGGGVATTGNAGDLLGQIGHTKVVSCTDAAWRLLGLSFAGWNAVVSALVVIGLTTAALRRN
jgi:disulfide bond formation protein DsbB